MIILKPPPTPEHCRFGIGGVSKGPTILRVLTSLLSSSSIIWGCLDVEAKFLEMRWHLGPWYPRETPLSISFSSSFTQFGSVWVFTSSSNCRRCKGVIICLRGLLLAGASTSWVFPSTASFVANVFELACLSSCIAPGDIKADANFSSCGCVCDDVDGWAKMWQNGWFAIVKIVACYCGISQSCAGWFGREAPDKYVLFVLIPGDFFVFRCKLSETAVILDACFSWVILKCCGDQGLVFEHL